jgi:hypothetical protein
MEKEKGSDSDDSRSRWRHWGTTALLALGPVLVGVAALVTALNGCSGSS